jgi:hypothetical protein
MHGWKYNETALYNEYLLVKMQEKRKTRPGSTAFNVLKQPIALHSLEIFICSITLKVRVNGFFCLVNELSTYKGILVVASFS